MLDKIIEKHFKHDGAQLDENNQKVYEQYTCIHCHNSLADKNIIEHYKSCGVLYEKFENKNPNSYKFMSNKYDI